MPRIPNVIVALLVALASFGYVRYVDRTPFGDRVYGVWRDVKRATYRGRGPVPRVCPTRISRAVMRSADCPSRNAKGAELLVARYVTHLDKEDDINTHLNCIYRDKSACSYMHFGVPELLLTDSEPPEFCATTTTQRTTTDRTTVARAEDEIYLGMPRWDCLAESQSGKALTMMILSKGPNVDYSGGTIMFQCGYGTQGCVYSANGTLDARFSEPECIDLPNLCAIESRMVDVPGKAPRKSGVAKESGRA